jgi:hypothetical protein
MKEIWKTLPNDLTRHILSLFIFKGLYRKEIKMNLHSSDKMRK